MSRAANRAELHADSGIDARTHELADRLERLHERIGKACFSAGRDASAVSAVIVTKTWPESDVRRLCALGVSDFGENRDQEAKVKAEQCADLSPTWHFVGQIQRKKANSVARYANFVHSIDRSELAVALDHGAGRAGRRIGCFVQVSLGESVGGRPALRGGVAAPEVKDICRSVANADQLDLVGLMGVPGLGDDPYDAFERLAAVHRDVLEDFPGATMLSAGMSGDLEAALANGATHVRVGSAVLGEREHVR